MINIYTCKHCNKPFERPKNQADFAIRRGRQINFCSLLYVALVWLIEPEPMSSVPIVLRPLKKEQIKSDPIIISVLSLAAQHIETKLLNLA